MPADKAEPRAFTVGDGPAIHGEAAGEGTPVVLCHGLTATRSSVVHGSRALERAGHAVVTYDARGHGESDPARGGGSYGYPELVDDLEAVVESQVGEGHFLLGGHSMGAHTAIAYALRHPERLAGLIAIGPSYPGSAAGKESLGYWDGLAGALEREGVEGFVTYIDRHQQIDLRWRDSVLRFTRERMLRHRHLDAIVEALRQVPRSKPFEGLGDLESIEVPTLVVASHDAADPGHPYEVAVGYAERIPRARLIGEEPGESPLAWQGGKLSRAIAAFAAGS
ncbi:MAG TPA: alpha/beta hydrolase [Solirubrobacterales bacterium]|jgi:pimeloyl-ACP methyl ester carboxylesterase